MTLPANMERRGPKGILHIRYYDQHGRQRRESTRTADLDTAKRILREREGAKDKGADISPKIGRLTFDEALELVVDDYVANAYDTVDEQKARIANHLQPFFGGARRFSTIDTIAITKYQVHRKRQGAANATINVECALLGRAFTLAVRAGLLLARPHVPHLEPAKPRQGFFERATFEAIRGELKEEIRPIVTVAYYTGWRLASELLRLEWGVHVDRDAKVIRLPAEMAKNDEGRVFPYGAIAELDAAIEECWTMGQGIRKRHGIPAPRRDDHAWERGRAFVFIRWEADRNVIVGERVRTIRAGWASARAAAGQPDALVHGFRRTAARRLTLGGVDRKVGKLLIGHKTDSMFERYSILDERDLSAELAKLGLGGGPSASPNKSKSKSKPAKSAESAHGLRLVKPA